MVKVVINEQHSLLPEQEQILKERFDTFEFLKVPATGWTLEEIKEIAEKNQKHVLVFVSPIQALMKYHSNNNGLWYVFHNDHREKVNLPDGRVISKVSNTGWKLV